MILRISFCTYCRCEAAEQFNGRWRQGREKGKEKEKELHFPLPRHFSESVTP